MFVWFAVAKKNALYFNKPEWTEQEWIEQATWRNGSVFEKWVYCTMKLPSKTHQSLFYYYYF